VTHDTPSVGGLVRIGPLALWAFHHQHSLVEVKSMAALHLKLTHPDSQLTRVCFQYVELLYDLLQAPAEHRPAMLKSALLAVSGQHFKRRPVACWADHEVIGGLYSSACYITDSWPAVLYLANKYADDTRKALQINTEMGGDNVHRGFVLATILGLVNEDLLDDWFQQLSCAPELNRHLQQAGLL
jgi:ADP-ribosylglycohydrolase